MKKTAILALVIVLSASVYAWAQSGHEGHSMKIPAADPMATMMHDMNQPKTGDADADFIRGMIPHHQGAIVMADEVLKNGKDPEIKMLAQDIIRAQQDEIRWMKEWLAKRGIPEKGAFTVTPTTTPKAE